MDLDEIRKLIAAFAASDLAELTLTRGDWTLHLVRSADGGVAAAPMKAPAKAPATARGTAVPTPPVAAPRTAGRAPAAADAAVAVSAPLSGLVYLSPTPGAPDFVAVGRRVEAGDVLAVIEAMKVFNEIRAERAGIVEAICVASDDEVEAGQLLMRIV